MFKDGQRYYTLSAYFKENFNKKLIKLPLDAGLSCPNRDGKLSTKGCLFCNETGSGDFTFSKDLNIKEQVKKQKKFLNKKSDSNSYIAYFQNFTNTYAPVEYLKKVFDEALSCEGVEGLAIATRPDCLGDDILDLLEEYNKKTFLWLELGLQTTNEKTALLINRGYDLNLFSDSFNKLKTRKIKAVIHLIFGLPFDSRDNMINSVKYISKIKPWGVKIHLLHILKDSPLFEYYKENPFHILSLEEYVSVITEAISYLDNDIVIHRLTGDGAKDKLIEPLWSLNKKFVLNSINKNLKKLDIIQGKKNN